MCCFSLKAALWLRFSSLTPTLSQRRGRKVAIISAQAGISYYSFYEIAACAEMTRRVGITKFFYYFIPLKALSALHCAR